MGGEPRHLPSPRAEEQGSLASPLSQQGIEGDRQAGGKKQEMGEKADKSEVGRE
jgi:hypothetical protein